MDKNYYNDYFYLERENWWFKVRASIIFDHLRKNIPSTRPLHILNVGAATGHTSVLLEEFGEVVSIEYDQECFEFTKEKLAINIINASATALPFADDTFDLVCAFDIIEHIEDDDVAVKEMGRVCKKEGILCLTVPAFMGLWSKHDDINQHHRRYIMSSLLPLLNELQGEIIYNTYFSTNLFIPLYVFRKLTRVIPEKWIRKDAGSDFTIIHRESKVNNVLYRIFSLERLWLQKYRFPFGSSILLSWTKK